jgi:hypothetical protein
MKITENELRSLTRNILKELFTRKKGLSGADFFGKEVDPHDYSGDAGGFGESDDLREEDIDEEEDLEEADTTTVDGGTISVSGPLSDSGSTAWDFVGPMPEKS